MSAVAAPRRRQRNRTPSYRLHRGSGQAVVTLNGRDIYLGVHGTPESQQAYRQTLGEYFANNCQVIYKSAAQSVSVTEVIAAFWKHAEAHYVHRDGRGPTSELHNFKSAARPLERLYGSTLAAKFGSMALQAVRSEMIRLGWARESINKHINRIRSIFKWAASKEMIPASVVEQLRTVAGLQPGRGGKEMPPVRPVPEMHIEAVRPFVSRQVWALIQLQLLTGARPGELVIMRPIDIDTTHETWVYRPAYHKTEHHGHDRDIYIGQRTQDILAPFLAGRAVNAHVFSPAEAEDERRAENHAARVTPLAYGNSPGTNQRAKPARKPGDYYDESSYRRAIQRACDQAFPAPDPLGRRAGESTAEWQARLTPDETLALKKWQREHRWHPHQLRHNAATIFRQHFGIEMARILLGHRSTDMTQIYAELNTQKAREVMKQIG